jgi:hypothetical protein
MVKREYGHSPLSRPGAEVKNEWSFALTPPARLHDEVLKHKDNFYLLFVLDYTAMMDERSQRTHVEDLWVMKEGRKEGRRKYSETGKKRKEGLKIRTEDLITKA